MKRYMKIPLKSLRYYFLTCDNPVRKEHFLKEFADLDITEVNPVVGIGRNPSGVSGFSRVLDLAVCNQRGSEGFQPFGIFEDDVKKYREFPEEVEIPDDADWLFTGLSYYGMSDYSHCYDVYHCGVNGDVVRMLNMLSVHGVIICSIRGLLAFQKCLIESYFTGTTLDIYTAQIQPYYNCYALRIPLVYQFGEIGGQEEATRVEFKGERPDIPDYWINKTNASILTCHPECNTIYPTGI